MNPLTGTRHWKRISPGRIFDDELVEQLDVLPKFVAACGFASAKAPGYEADDFLAAAASREERRGGTCIVASGDRDSYQLASRHTTIVQPVRAGELVRIRPSEVRARYGVEPRQVPDFIALRGHSRTVFRALGASGRSTPLHYWSITARWRRCSQPEGLRRRQRNCFFISRSPRWTRQRRSRGSATRNPPGPRPPCSHAGGNSTSLRTASMRWRRHAEGGCCCLSAPALVFLASALSASASAFAAASAFALSASSCFCLSASAVPLSASGLGASVALSLGCCSCPLTFGASGCAFAASPCRFSASPCAFSASGRFCFPTSCWAYRMGRPCRVGIDLRRGLGRLFSLGSIEHLLLGLRFVLCFALLLLGFGLRLLGLALLLSLLRRAFSASRRCCFSASAFALSASRCCCLLGFGLGLLGLALLLLGFGLGLLSLPLLLLLCFGLRLPPRAAASRLRPGLLRLAPLLLLGFGLASRPARLLLQPAPSPPRAAAASRLRPGPSPPRAAAASRLRPGPSPPRAAASRLRLLPWQLCPCLATCSLGAASDGGRLGGSPCAATGEVSRARKRYRGDVSENKVARVIAIHGTPSRRVDLHRACGNESASRCAATSVAQRGVGTWPPRLAFLAHRKHPMEEVHETHFDRNDARFGYWLCSLRPRAGAETRRQCRTSANEPHG